MTLTELYDRFKIKSEEEKQLDLAQKAEAKQAYLDSKEPNPEALAALNNLKEPTPPVQQQVIRTRRP